LGIPWISQVTSFKFKSEIEQKMRSLGIKRGGNRVCLFLSVLFDDEDEEVVVGAVWLITTGEPGPEDSDEEERCMTELKGSSG